MRLCLEGGISETVGKFCVGENGVVGEMESVRLPHWPDQQCARNLGNGPARTESHFVIKCLGVLLALCI